MVAWWQQLAQREKIVLGVGGGLLLLMGWYFVWLEPLQKRTAQLQQNTAARQTQLAEMKAMAATINEFHGILAPLSVAEILAQHEVSAQPLADGSRGVQTAPLSITQAKTLLLALAPVAVVSMEIVDAEAVEGVEAVGNNPAGNNSVEHGGKIILTVIANAN
ncbi:type II secretion system protein GspM [Ostreibacterium oceani]|nr:type II secretion system protein GspM [Ostreibacterium oceani]